MLTTLFWLPGILRAAHTNMFQTLEREEGQIVLKINEQKATKYLKMSASKTRIVEGICKIGSYTFENVHRFIYLGKELNNTNQVSHKMNKRLMAGNRAYYSNMKLLKSRMISHRTKMKLYRTLIRPVVTYGSEAWTLTGKDCGALQVFERKIIRKIYGPIKDGETWRARYNCEIDDLIKGENIVRFIKSRRISWLGHLERMGRDRQPKQIFEAEIRGVRRRGRPRRRWLQEVEADLKALGIRNWRHLAGERSEWRRIVEEAKAHIGL